MYGIALGRLMKKVGQNIQKAREEKGLSQYDLADELLTSQSVVSNWERGKVLPRIDNLLLMCKIMSVDLPGLIDWQEMDSYIQDLN